MFLQILIASNHKIMISYNLKRIKIFMFSNLRHSILPCIFDIQNSLVLRKRSRHIPVRTIPQFTVDEKVSKRSIDLKRETFGETSERKNERRRWPLT